MLNAKSSITLAQTAILFWLCFALSWNKMVVCQLHKVYLNAGINNILAY